MEKKYADHIIKRKRLSKTKTVIIYRRNNLSLKNLVREGSQYYYTEIYEHRGIIAKFEMKIYSENVEDIFLVNTKTFKIKGGRNQFGIFIRLEDQNLPIKDENIVGCVEYMLLIKGCRERLYYDKSQRRRKEYVPKIHNTSATTSVTIPNSVLWSAKHPYRGGGFSPK